MSWYIFSGEGQSTIGKQAPLLTAIFGMQDHCYNCTASCVCAITLPTTGLKRTNIL